MADPTTDAPASDSAAASAPTWPPPAGDDRATMLGPGGLAEAVPPVSLLRWGTLVVGAALAAPDLLEGDPATLGWGAVLLVYTVYRTARPLVDRGRFIDLLLLLADTAIHVASVVATGSWESPYALAAVNAIVVGGFARGFSFAFRLAVASALAVGIPMISLADDSAAATQTSLAWSAILVLVAVIAGYSVRLFGAAVTAQEHALGQMEQLSQANSLLLALNRVAQTMPASLDEAQVVETTLARVRSVLEASAVVIALRDTEEGSWRLVAARGVRLPGLMSDGELPAPARMAVRSGTLHQVGDVWVDGLEGFSPRGRSGIYVPLSIREEVTGLLAIEANRPHAFDDAQAQALRRAAAPAALSFANAVLFRRLRAVGAEEERTRIARDLHDRVGQSLAYLAFELDRITRRSAEDDITDDLAGLRNDVRRVVTEVRETLYDIRSEVDDDHPIAEVLDQFLERVRERSGIAVALRVDQTGERLPIPQEREMWRVAQEAVVNAERHAGASSITVWWRCEPLTASVSITDDGVGFEAGTEARLDSYGLVGMRERAAAIGARLTIDTTPGRGTTVRCTLSRQ